MRLPNKKYQIWFLKWSPMFMDCKNELVSLGQYCFCLPLRMCWPSILQVVTSVATYINQCTQNPSTTRIKQRNATSSESIVDANASTWCLYYQSTIFLYIRGLQVAAIKSYRNKAMFPLGNSNFLWPGDRDRYLNAIVRFKQYARTSKVYSIPLECLWIKCKRAISTSNESKLMDFDGNDIRKFSSYCKKKLPFDQ